MLNPNHKSKYQRACDIAKARGEVSVGILQRELKIDLGDALRLIQLMQEKDIIGIRDHRSVCVYYGGEK